MSPLYGCGYLPRAACEVLYLVFIVSTLRTLGPNKGKGKRRHRLPIADCRCRWRLSAISVSGCAWRGRDTWANCIRIWEGDRERETRSVSIWKRVSRIRRLPPYLLPLIAFNQRQTTPTLQSARGVKWISGLPTVGPIGLLQHCRVYRIQNLLPDSLSRLFFIIEAMSQLMISFSGAANRQLWLEPILIIYANL